MESTKIMIGLLLGVLISLSNAEWNQYMENPENFEGDILLNENQTRILNSGNLFGLSKANGFNKRWPKGVPIAYEFADEFKTDANKKGKLLAAMKSYEEETCLRFVERTDQKQFMHFRNGRGCSSHVGMQYSGNFINLAGGCFSRGTLLHEMAHSLGIWHEQSRGDRDQYVKIHPENMACCSSNFNKMGPYIDSLGFPYDYESMMHYGAYAFGNGKGPTIEVLQSGKRIGQRNGFSKIDIQQINAMYCEDRPETPSPPTVPTRRPTRAPRGKIFGHASSTKCLGLNKNSELIFTSDCTTRFEVMEGALWTAGYKCAETEGTSSGSSIRFQQNCNHGFSKTSQDGEYFALKHRETGKCIHPKGGSSRPSIGTKAILYHSCNDGRRIQFREV